jgi:hypothetical protein
MLVFIVCAHECVVVCVLCVCVCERERVCVWKVCFLRGLPHEHVYLCNRWLLTRTLPHELLQMTHLRLHVIQALLMWMRCLLCTCMHVSGVRRHVVPVLCFVRVCCCWCWCACDLTIVLIVCTHASTFSPLLSLHSLCLHTYNSLDDDGAAGAAGAAAAERPAASDCWNSAS